MDAHSSADIEAEPEVRRPGRRPSPRIAQFLRTWYFLRRNTLAMIGLVIILFIVGVAIYALFQPIPYSNLETYCATNGHATCSPGINICTYPQGTTAPGPGCYMTPVEGGVAEYPTVIAPTIDWHHLTPGALPLGSLTLVAQGVNFYNIYNGLLRGSDWSLLIAITVVITGAAIGTLLGVVAGTLGGVVDEVIMRFVDIFLSIPQILFVIVAVAVLQTNTFFSSFTARIGLLILAFIVIWWPFYTRLVRGQVLVVREQRFVEAARASGAKRGRIMFRHILPNSVYPVFIQVSLDVGIVPLLVGALVFLGFAVIPQTVGSGLFPEWGSITALSSRPLISFLTTCQLGSCIIPWWQFFFPGLALFLFAISVNFLSDGLRDALDPRMRR